LKFIGYGLYHKREQKQHPYPVCPAEAGGVKQRERCKERATERDQRGKGVFPLAAQGIYDQFLFIFRLRDRMDHRLSALHKKKKYQQSSQQRYYKPPVIL